MINLLCCFQKFNKTLPKQEEEQLRASTKTITNEINPSKAYTDDKRNEQINIKQESSSSQTTLQTFSNERNLISLNTIKIQKESYNTLSNMNSLKQTVGKRLKDLTDSLKSKKRSECTTTDTSLNNKKTGNNNQEKEKRSKTSTDSLESKTKGSKVLITHNKVSNIAQNLKIKKREHTDEKLKKEDPTVVKYKHESYLHDEIQSESQIRF